MKKHAFTYVLVLMVFGTLSLAFARHKQASPTNSEKDDQQKQQQDKKSRFPIAEYEEPESTDATKNRILKEKQSRHNDFKIVAKNPPEWQTERVFVPEGGMDFPALPVTESTYIVVGMVTGAEAHVSENKKNVFSEFTVSVNRVLKTANSSVGEGNEITVSRIGGFVRYPNKKTVLYRISGSNMPTVGEKYLFFLTSKNNQDLTIVTAYALGFDGVAPLDESQQFEALRGLTEEALFQKLNESVVKSSPY
jgi:hypothetical protein